MVYPELNHPIPSTLYDLTGKLAYPIQETDMVAVIKRFEIDIVVAFVAFVGAVIILGPFVSNEIANTSTGGLKPEQMAYLDSTDFDTYPNLKERPKKELALLGTDYCNMVEDDMERSGATGWISLAMLLDDYPSTQRGEG